MASEPTGKKSELQGPKPEGAESEHMEPGDTELDGPDQELWDEMDEPLFEDGPYETLKADRSSAETASGPSAMPSAGAPTEPTPGPSTKQSSQPPTISTPTAAVEEGIGSPANPSLPVIGVPSPATLETAIGSQTDTSSTVAVNPLASSISTALSSSLAPSSSNSAQSPSSLTQ